MRKKMSNPIQPYLLLHMSLGPRKMNQSLEEVCDGRWSTVIDGAALSLCATATLQVHCSHTSLA